MNTTRRIAALGSLVLLLAVGPGRAQTAVGPLSDEYRLVVGDGIEVVLDGHPDLTRTYTVPANGIVSFPPLGKVKLVGKTTEELEAEIADGFKAKGEFTDPRVYVVITSFEPRNAFLIGAITSTIPLPVHKKYNIVQVLSLAGATPVQADLSEVKVIRKRADGSTFEFSVNVKEVLVDGDYEKNIDIMPDDIIYIQPRTTALENKWVYVLGKVNRPGRYGFVPEKEEMTLLKAITLAGDFHQFARPSAIKLLRKEGKRTRVSEIDFDEIIDGEIKDIILEPDDVLFVPESIF